MKALMTPSEEKSRMAILEIAESSPLVVLSYEDEKTSGLLLATKLQSEILPWRMIPLKRTSEKTSGAPPYSSDSLDNQLPSIAFLLFAGVGNYAEFNQVVEHAKNLVHGEFSLIGPHEGITESLVRGISLRMNEEFRALDPNVPYRVELILISSLIKGSLGVFRIKYDGEYHPVSPYCIIGGYKNATNCKITVRSRALGYLKKLYNNKSISLDEARSAAKKILNLRKEAGEYKEAVLEFEK